MRWSAMTILTKMVNQDWGEPFHRELLITQTEHTHHQGRWDLLITHPEHNHCHQSLLITMGKSTAM